MPRVVQDDLPEGLDGQDGAVAVWEKLEADCRGVLHGPRASPWVKRMHGDNQELSLWIDNSHDAMVVASP